MASHCSNASQTTVEGFTALECEMSTLSRSTDSVLVEIGIQFFLGGEAKLYSLKNLSPSIANHRRLGLGKRLVLCQRTTPATDSESRRVFGEFMYGGSYARVSRGAAKRCLITVDGCQFSPLNNTDDRGPYRARHLASKHDSSREIT